MKTIRIPGILRGLAVAVGGFALFTGGLQAAPFLYSSGDLVLAFRKTGNASDYVVNIGKATNYTSVPKGTSFVVTNLSSAQLAAAFPSLNGVKWSAAAANRPPVDGNYPIQTLWVTAARTAPLVQSTPWLRKGQSLQGNAGSQIDAIGNNAALTSGLLPAGANNTATGVVLPVDASYPIGPVLGTSGDYVGNFQGSVETTTSDTFTGNTNNVSRADLYELQPAPSASNLPGRHLGYFELKPDGTLTFNGPAIPQATISSVTRVGSITTISFPSQTGYVYRLRKTTAAGLTTALSTWSTGATVVGTGSALSLQDNNSDGITFYSVEAYAQ